MVHAQQVQQFTQFQHVGLAFNPAFAGSDTYFNGFAVHRTQWAGINDAPRTYMMGLHAPSASGKMGFGGTLYTDVTGPTRRTGINGTYAYHVQLTEGTKLSLGITGGITQFSLDGTQIKLREEGDMALLPMMMSELKPDASFGALWYGDHFHVGVSAGQIIPNRLRYFPGDGDGTTVVHYYFTGAYRFDLSEDFAIEPAVLVKYTGPLAPQADLSARAIYKGNLWLGGSYRTNAAAAVYAGYRVLDYLMIGYSMDFATSDIRNYSDGCHEIVLGLRFLRKQVAIPKTE
jgi:type IX secretion system PorP/SprF family membrane protein